MNQTEFYNLKDYCDDCGNFGWLIPVKTSPKKQKYLCKKCKRDRERNLEL